MASRTASAKHVANGTFDVKLAPIDGAPSGMTAMSIDKRFSGDLEGTSTGRMLAVRTPVENSAGYVAMEIVTGTLAGRHGSFALQHSGTMDKGAQSLRIDVVPDSGSGDLQGISGQMEIKIEGGRHDYRLLYDLPERD